MHRIIVAIPHSHTWFWTASCVSSLIKNPPILEGFDVKVVIVDNSPWSPAIKGITETSLLKRLQFINFEVIDNHKSNKFHASALDCVVEKYDFDYMMAMETDVLALRPSWLWWFMNQMRPKDFAVGMWHHEQFVNPSCTLYRGQVLKEMMDWCANDAPQDELRWGDRFIKTGPLDINHSPGDPALSNMKRWIAGPFAEKRGWPVGTELREKPSGQEKGPGWYEPGQQLHHWAVENGHTYTICDTTTAHREPGLPIETLYGSLVRGRNPNDDQEAVQILGIAETAHMWGGTRALDILKHPVTCEFVKKNTPYWLAREARFWRNIVPEDVRNHTLELIREHGWHITGQGTNYVTERDKEAAEYVRSCYRIGGVEW